MILTTGGRASGATSTRSRPRSFAAAIASSIVSTPTYHSVDGKLVQPFLVHKPDALPVLCQSPRDDMGVVLENQQPLLRFGALIQPAARLERDERLQIVAHDPRQRQMGRRGHEIGYKAGPLGAALDQDRLVKRDVTRCRDPANPPQDLRFAVDQLEGHALEVVGEITAGRALIGMLRELELTTLDDVTRLREGQADLPRWIAVGVAAGVVEMQVGIDDPAHVVRLVAQFAERVLQAGAAISAGVCDAVDVAKFLVFLVADAGVDEHEPVVMFDEQAP